MTETETEDVIMAALHACNDRPREAEVEHAKSVDFLDGYAMGYERAAKCVAKHLGRPDIAALLIGDEHD